MLGRCRVARLRQCASGPTDLVGLMWVFRRLGIEDPHRQPQRDRRLHWVSPSLPPGGVVDVEYSQWYGWGDAWDDYTSLASRAGCRTGVAASLGHRRARREPQYQAALLFPEAPWSFTAYAGRRQTVMRSFGRCASVHPVSLRAAPSTDGRSSCGDRKNMRDVELAARHRR